MNVTIVIPTYNEELVIGKSLETSVLAFETLLGERSWSILVADNGSTDRTPEIVADFSKECPRVGLFEVGQKGKGLAIRRAWESHDADVYAFMDADLATDLRDVPALIRGAEDVGLCVGSRFHRDAKVVRSAFRHVVSHSYRLIARALVDIDAEDLQCGFKAVRKDVADAVLPRLVHDGFFFDTEFLGHAQALGFQMAEVPVRWEEGRDARRKTSVKIGATAWDNFQNLLVLRKELRRLAKAA